MSETIAAVIQDMLARGGFGQYIPNADIDSVAAGSFTSVRWLRSNQYSTNEFFNEGAIVWRPGAASAADYIRYAGELTKTTGALAVDANWADTTITSEDIYLLRHGIRPEWIIDALNGANREIYFFNREPLSLAADAGFQSSATTAYTVGATGTFSKVTTAANVYPGMLRAGRFQAAADGDYIYQAFNVNAGESVYVGWLVRADVGTADLILYDATNSAEINSSGGVTYAGEHWAYLWRIETVPSGCEVMQVRLAGVESTADLYMNGLWVYRQNEYLMPLASQWDTSFKAMTVTRGKHFSNVDTGVEVAYSADWAAVERDAYGYEFVRPASTPNVLHFHHGELQLNQPYYIQGRRPHADVEGPFDMASITDGDTTTIDLDLFSAAARMHLFRDGRVRARYDAAGEQYGRAAAEYEALAPQFVIRGAEPARTRERIVYAPGRGL